MLRLNNLEYYIDMVRSIMSAAAPMFSTAEVKNRKTGIYQFREIIG